MTERRLGSILIVHFGRLTWSTLAGYGALVIASFAGFSELTLRRSLEHSADVAQSLIGMYADPNGARSTVAPAMLADQLIGTGAPFLITRTIADRSGGRTIYFLSPTMPAKRIEPSGSGPQLAQAIVERGRGWYRVLNRRAGEFDILVVGSRRPYLAGLGGLTALALALLPAVALLARRAARRTVVTALGPLARMADETQRIGPPPHDLHARATVPTGVTEVSELAHALNRLLERVESSHRALEAFTADASHELRTPLTRLRAQAQWALDERRTAEEMREGLADIARSSEQMTRMVQDLLLIARGDNQQLSLERRRFDLAPVIREVEEIAVAMGGDRSVAVRAELNGPCHALGDPARTREILLNLASNAVRHTTEGSITFGCERNGTMVGVAVRDTGCGIGAADRERIFDRFYRAEPSRSRDHGGTGLGLTIARLLAELQQGRITVESTPGRGSRFVLWLQAAEEV